MSTHKRKNNLFQKTIPQSGMLQTVKESVAAGVGTGIGFSLADRLVSSVFGNRTVKVEHIVGPMASSNPDCKDIEDQIRQHIQKGNTMSVELWDQYQMCKKV